MKSYFSASQVSLHPHSVKYLQKGHPWVTQDRFTDKFPRNSSLLIGIDEKRRPKNLLIHDPNHPSIKARAWLHSTPTQNDVHEFWTEFSNRLERAISYRKSSTIMEERENVYLVFGESDFLPGLFIQKLANSILIQIYCHFWIEHQKKLFSILRSVLRSQFGKDFPKSIWMQVRNENKKVSFYKISPHNLKKTQNEFSPKDNY